MLLPATKGTFVNKGWDNLVYTFLYTSLYFLYVSDRFQIGFRFEQKKITYPLTNGFFRCIFAAPKDYWETIY